MDLVHLPASFTSRTSPNDILRATFGECTVPFGGFGSFGRLRGTSCTLRWSSGGFGPPSGYLLYPSAASGASGRLRVPPVPFGDPPEASGRLRGISCTLRWVLFAGLVGPVGCPYDKPLAVDVLLRHG